MDEYEACIRGIKMAVDMKINERLVIGDSDLLIYQVQEEWSTNNVKILSYLHYMKELCRMCTKKEFTHFPRVKSEFADALAILSFMIQHPDKNYIDPIEIEIRDQHAYCLHVNKEPEAINRFTIWVEESTYKAITKKLAADFGRNNIICRFGIPESIITDKTPNLNSDLMREICEKFRIVHRNSITYRTQMNGAVEAANKNI
ncbi:PREDICTED: uncharacterized protein LOC109216839 [Nicotiana attenuata]|uniref:uncharacterized protein LOC109216839 n=1 Tax=Nicotiana attenuata TaxID=49451 RepID=UPI00090532FB|nr:PREDICTED: uncharacterized protein LOC109216839 [Nicotiana attenuata]